MQAHAAPITDEEMYPTKVDVDELGRLILSLSPDQVTKFLLEDVFDTVWLVISRSDAIAGKFYTMPTPAPTSLLSQQQYNNTTYSCYEPSDQSHAHYGSIPIRGISTLV